MILLYIYSLFIVIKVNCPTTALSILILVTHGKLQERLAYRDLRLIHTLCPPTSAALADEEEEGIFI